MTVQVTVDTSSVALSPARIEYLSCADDGVTLGPEDALHREIEKTKALKVEKDSMKKVENDYKECVKEEEN